MAASSRCCFPALYPPSIPILVHGVNVRTTVADSVAVADSAIEELRSILRSKPKKVVGLDCDCRPNEPGQAPNKVATLQLCSEDFIVILQLLYLEFMPDSLRSFLDDPQVTFAGSKMRAHAAKLRDDHGLLVRNGIDVGALEINKPDGDFVLTPHDVEAMQPWREDSEAPEVTCVNVDKPEHVRRSDWQARMLSDEQIEFACIFGFANYEIGRKLLVEGGWHVQPNIWLDM